MSEIAWFRQPGGKTGFRYPAAAIPAGDDRGPYGGRACPPEQDCPGGRMRLTNVHAAEKRLSRHLKSEGCDTVALSENAAR